MKYLCVLFSLLFMSVQALAGDGFYLGAGVGKGDVSVDNSNFPGSELLDSSSDDVIATEISAGYEFSNNIGLDVTAALYDTAQFIFETEQADLNSFRLGVSYAIPTESNFHFYGRTGINFWQLDIEESGLFNSGIEERVKTSSQDVFFQLGGEYRFNQRFRLGFAYDRTKTDFGHVDGFKVNIKFFP